MGIAQIWTEQGEQFGENGEQKGRKAEGVTLLTRQLRRKFGAHPELETALQRLTEMPLENLEDLADALLEFRDITDLQAWLSKY